MRWPKLKLLDCAQEVEALAYALHSQSLHRFGGEPIAHLCRSLIPAKVRRDAALAQSCSHGSTESCCFRFPAEEFQHHRRSEDRTQWIGDSLSCNIWCRAVYWLEQRSLAWVNVS